MLVMPPCTYTVLQINAFDLCLFCSIPGIVVCGIDVSPIIHLRLKNSIGSRAKKQQFFNTVATKCHSQGLAVVTGKYIENEEQYLPPPR